MAASAEDALSERLGDLLPAARPPRAPAPMAAVSGGVSAADCADALMPYMDLSDR